MRRAGFTLLCTVFALAAQAAPPVDPSILEERLILVPWDPWSLQDHRLANRFLFEQLAAPEQQSRLFANGETLIAAADAQTGTSLGSRDPPNPWHGYVVGDLFAAARLWEGIELNVNLLAYNATSSAGVRRATGILPGVAAHLYGETGDVTLDFLATDLGAVTLGRGLMFEQLEMEGALLKAEWNGIWLRGLIGGQVHVAQDDLFVISMGMAGLSLDWMAWNQQTGMPHYLSVSGDLPGLGPHLRLAAQGAVRLPFQGQSARVAAMLRADWMPPATRDWTLHLGYQARFYQQGVGPGGEAVTPVSTGPALIAREDTWLTNAFDAWWPSVYYDQWWHTVMFEAHWQVFDGWALRGEVEGALKMYDDPQSPTRRLPRVGSDGSGPLYPDADLRVMYRAGIEATPFDGPHRLRLWMMNKATPTIPQAVPFPTQTRFVRRGPTIAFEVEIFL
ncbi:MAG: hypothetical protein ACI9U2_001881 [Bradymonadia bacterium]|jgi:hypothetical protein